MAIVKMKKLRAIALRQQRDELMRQLLRLGCVEVHEPEGMLSDPEAAEALRPERAGLAEARTREAEMDSALKVMARYAPEKKKMLSPRPTVSQEEFLDGEALKADEALAQQINDWDGQIRRIGLEQVRIRDEIESLRPWEALDMPLETEGTKTCSLALANVPAQVDMESVADAAERATELVQLILVSQDEQQKCFLIITPKEELAGVLDAMRGVGCTPVTFPGVTGTAADNIDQRKKRLAELDVERKDLEAKIGQEKGKTASLRLSADRLATEAAEAEAAERLRGTDSVVALEGWFPAEDEAAVTKCLNGFDCAFEFADPTEDEYPDVPVKLKNNPITRPLNMVTDMYALPAYTGVDPNPLMAPFFILFYGMMMADMGYGLIMMLVSLIVVKKAKPRGPTVRNMFPLLGLCGVSTFFFGAITGGFFGDFLPQLMKLINPESTFALPALFSPLDDALAVLVGSLALGIVQILTGMAVSAWKKCKDGDKLGALFEEGTWTVILIGLGLFAALKTPIGLAVGGVMLVIGSACKAVKNGGGPVKIAVSTLTGVGGSLYNNITGYFSDILSYSRLMALMLAGAVIAQVFNTLGGITGNVFAFVLISMVGNALNFALNLLGCFVHDMRLQCLEFFGRFYEDGGKPFRPLDMETKFVDIVKE